MIKGFSRGLPGSLQVWYTLLLTCLLLYICNILRIFLNQVRTGLWAARAWFLKIDPVQIVGMRVCVCVCVSAPEAINN